MLHDIETRLGLDLTWTSAALTAGGLLLVSLATRALLAGIRRGRRRLGGRRRWSGTQVLIAVAIAAAAGVAVIGGVRSFNAVSEEFDSPLVPLVADGMIVACTALRLAALTRGWRLPGALVTTYVFIGGTVWLNVDTAHGVADAIAHALAPIAYAALVEMLAHMLRLHLRLAQPTRARVTALTWFTSPLVTTRVWLHLARTGADDPIAARAVVQQVVRMSSRLRTLCPNPAPWPFGSAHAARAAALQTIRDGLLSARDLADLLPDTGRLEPGALLALVDGAALRCTTPTTNTPASPCTRAHAPVRAPSPDGAPRPVRTTPAPSAPSVSAPVARPERDERTDPDLVAELHQHAALTGDGGPLSQREVMRVLGVGTPKAKRLVIAAGWADSNPRPQPHAVNGEGRDEIPGQTRPRLCEHLHP